MNERREGGRDSGEAGQGPAGTAPGPAGTAPGPAGAAPGPGETVQGPGEAGQGPRTPGREQYEVGRAGLEARQELRERGRELRELTRERARELRELARSQREIKREQVRELRELGRAQRAMARGLLGRGLDDHETSGMWGREDKDQRSTRERILDVALDIFVEQGYDKASLREIAERMGFTKAALYYHFPSKADMLLALHQRMHGLIDEPVMLLGEGPVSVEAWERFLDACIDKLQANGKLLQLHRVNQAALGEVHSKGHEGAHLDLEERARKIFSEPSLNPVDRLRMMAAFAVAFIPMMAGGLFPETDHDFLTKGLREVVHRVLQPEVAKREAEDRAPGEKHRAEAEAAADKREAEDRAPAPKHATAKGGTRRGEEQQAAQ